MDRGLLVWVLFLLMLRIFEIIGRMLEEVCELHH